MIIDNRMIVGDETVYETRNLYVWSGASEVMTIFPELR